MQDTETNNENTATAEQAKPDIADVPAVGKKLSFSEKMKLYSQKAKDLGDKAMEYKGKAMEYKDKAIEMGAKTSVIAKSLTGKAKETVGSAKDKMEEVKEKGEELAEKAQEIKEAAGEKLEVAKEKLDDAKDYVDGVTEKPKSFFEKAKEMTSKAMETASDLLEKTVPYIGNNEEYEKIKEDKILVFLAIQKDEPESKKFLLKMPLIMKDVWINGVTFKVVDIDESKELADKLELSKAPALLVFEIGEEKKRTEDIEEINRYLKEFTI